MAFTTMIQQVEKPAGPSSTPLPNHAADALLGMLMLSIYGAQMSKKTVRKLKRKFFLTSLKLKLQSLFSAKREFSDRQLLYIIAGAAFIALLFLSPAAALVLALAVLILILAGVI
ncbi:MAG TPA: hypothetical protein VM871_00795 [Flavisolibacter sp.]|nr:hypothetical protein [Flavisolibacter sp.]